MTSSRTTVPRPCACTTVRTTSRLLARAYDSALQDTELNVTQLAVLRAIERAPGDPLSRIAKHLSMDRTSMYRSVAKMRDYGWVSVHEGADARSRSAAITKSGAKALERAAPRWDAIQSAVVNRFGRRRWRALVEELEALRSVVDAVGDEVANGATR